MRSADPTDGSRLQTRHHILRGTLTALHTLGLDRLFATFSKTRGAILTLHHVREERRRGFAPNAHLSARAEFLDDLIDELRRDDVDIVAIDEVPERLSARAERRFVVLTFDDGYRDNLTNAVPVLRGQIAPFTIYVTTGFVDRSSAPWWEALESLVRRQDRLLVQGEGGRVMDLDCSSVAAKDESYEFLIDHFKTDVPEAEVAQCVEELCWLYGVDANKIVTTQIMDSDELAALSRDPLCTLGAHTTTHRSLARLSREEAASEIAQGRDELQEISGERPRHLAYPYGFPAAAGAREFALATELGFETAVTTRRGVLYDAHAEHLTALPRISLNGHYQERRYVVPLLTGLPTAIARGFRKLDVA